MRRSGGLLTAASIVLLAGPASVARSAPQAAPRDLVDLASKAGIESPALKWCRGEFRAGQAGAFAVAIGSPGGGGRYLVLAPGTAAVELAAFKDGADVTCYTAAEARKLNVTIASSSTIHGHLAPRWTTTVVCGFTENTAAECWQYSPAESRFVKIGGWAT